jgi:acetolactate synthase-1/2/3 large subunit
MTGGHAIVRTLRAQGFAQLFSLPGLQLDSLFNALYDEAARGPQVIHCRHEQGAAYMAFGAAQSTGKPAAFAVVPGPGFLNASAALATAYACNAPVLAISGQLPLKHIGRGIGWLHELPDQIAIARGLSKWAARIEHPSAAPAALREAMRQMTTGRQRPAYVEIPMDVLGQSADVELEGETAAAAPPTLDPDMVSKAAAALGNAHHPLIVAGGGVFDACEELHALARLLQAPVVMTRNAFGAIDIRDPLALNEIAGHRLWGEADVVLAVGTRFQLQTIGSARPDSAWGTGDGMKVIRIDVDPAEIVRFREPFAGFAADARQVLAALIEEVPRFNRSRPSRAEALQALKQQVDAELKSSLGLQMAYLGVLRDELPEDGFFVEELTQVGYVARVAFPTYRPRTYVSTGYQGSLGFGFATALGVKAAHPGRAVVSISGDGGFLFTAMELATAARHGIAVAAVVFNDGAFGNVRRMQQDIHGGKVIATDLANPDFVALARSFGLDAERVGSPEELRPALSRALARSSTTVIEVTAPQLPDPWGFIRLPAVRPA